MSDGFVARPLHRGGPSGSEHTSRRTDVVLSTERGMVGSMQELRIQAVEKNKAFLRRVAALRARRSRVADRLRAEVSERDTQLASVRDSVESAFRASEAALLGAIGGRHDRLGAKLIPLRAGGEEERAAEVRFYREAVPARNEEMVGELVRRMLRERQSFDIDKVKVRARGREVEDRFVRWKRAVVVRRRAELEDRAETFHGLGEQMREALQSSRRDAHKAQHFVVRRLQSLQAAIQLEAQHRLQHDAYATEQLQTVMARIQTDILENFGADQEDSFEEEEEEEEEEEGEEGGVGAEGEAGEGEETKTE